MINESNPPKWFVFIMSCVMLAVAAWTISVAAWWTGEVQDFEGFWIGIPVIGSIVFWVISCFLVIFAFGIWFIPDDNKKEEKADD